MLDRKYFDKLRKRLNDFSDYDARSDTIADVRNKLDKFFCYSGLVANIGDCSVYRVRKINLGETHDKAVDVWNLPTERCKLIGRANDVGQSVFYGSLDAQTAIIEKKVKADEFFSLAIFKLILLEYLNMTSLVIKELDLIDGHDSDLEMFQVELNKFMVKEFTKDVPDKEDYHYKKSCVIAERLFNHPNKDSILYPSVKCHDSINIALKAENACKRLTLTNVLTCKIDENRKIFVHDMKLPSADGNLKVTKQNFELPCLFNCKGAKSTFSNIFDEKNIPSVKQMIDYHLSQQID